MQRKTGGLSWLLSLIGVVGQPAAAAETPTEQRLSPENLQVSEALFCSAAPVTVSRYP